MRVETTATDTPNVGQWRDTTLRRNERTSWNARQATGLWLASSHPTLRSDALQIVAELVANVIQHVPGGQQRDWVTLRLGFGNGFVRLEVIDPGTSDAEPRFTPPAGSLAESGRGLGIVTGLSIRHGTDVIEDGHRIVWADLAVVP
ncbi:ATP-binding protein [Nonomuraea sp. NPDC050404]|uniref:ATP-binding protein n=1 Tax=Nonomuraea sp. NPDC050404 TaxID=3155783 RepID=UPI0033CFD4F0